VNLVARGAGEVFDRGYNLPSGGELTEYLASRFYYPPNEPRDLARVSQHADVMLGIASLYDRLHEVFDADFPPSAVHRVLAHAPAVLSSKGYSPSHQLIVTTNYDDVLERAFREAGEPFDLVCYVAEGPSRGRFRHQPYERPSRSIDIPNEYSDLPVGKRTVILKIHGAVDRTDEEQDSYVITEDHYIDYLALADVRSLMPASLLGVLERSHLLFLGYSLRDWNLRVILHRVWREARLNNKSWAVQWTVSPIDQGLWRKHNVDILETDVGRYMEALELALQALPPAPAPTR
jgi:hypothetical protein